MEGQRELRAPYARRMRGLLRGYARHMRAFCPPARAKLRAEPANFFNLPPKSESLPTTSEMNQQVATKEVASLDNQLGLTPFAYAAALDTEKKHQQDAAKETDEVVMEECAPSKDAGESCCGDPFQGHFYGDTYEIKGQSGLIHEFNVDEFNEDNDGKFASYC